MVGGRASGVRFKRAVSCRRRSSSESDRKSERRRRSRPRRRRSPRVDSPARDRGCSCHTHPPLAAEGLAGPVGWLRGAARAHKPSLPLLAQDPQRHDEVLPEHVRHAEGDRCAPHHPRRPRRAGGGPRARTGWSCRTRRAGRDDHDRAGARAGRGSAPLVHADLAGNKFSCAGAKSLVGPVMANDALVSLNLKGGQTADQTAQGKRRGPQAGSLGQGQFARRRVGHRDCEVHRGQWRADKGARKFNCIMTRVSLSPFLGARAGGPPRQ